MKRTVSEKLEYALLQIVMGSTANEGTHQDLWGEWENTVSRHLQDRFSRGDLKDAFKRLHERGLLRLSKWHDGDPHPRDYSGKDASDETFFFIGPFTARITAEGRSHWDRLRMQKDRSGVFISHITEEQSVAHVLQKYLKLAFGEDFPVFVSSDAKSIGGGQKWYSHIIDSLRSSEIVLVLVSQESRGRTWINFEAGVGEGSECLVIPVAVNQLSPPRGSPQKRPVGVTSKPAS